MQTLRLGAEFSILPFAEAPQASDFLFRHLRKLRKHQISCFAICGSSASTKFSVLTFAEAPQASNSLFRYLRKLRKHQISCFDLCGSSASIKFLVSPFAEAPQAPNSLFRHLRKLRRHSLEIDKWTNITSMHCEEISQPCHFCSRE